MSNTSPGGGKVISGFLWSFAERCGAQAVTFIVGLILARLLTPDDYGTVAIMTVFTGLLTVFVDSGLAASLIQKKDADDADFSTVFYFNVGFCLFLYMVLFFCAPLISSSYGDASLTAPLRVLGITIIVSGLKNVQHAYVSKTLQFRLFFFSTLGGTIVAAVVGIVMAYLGFGVWAIVTQHLTNLVIDTCVLWVTTGWRPKKLFSFTRLKSSFSYGCKILASALLSTLITDIRQIIIGYRYSASDLSYYNKGSQLPSMITNNINTAIDSVLFPALSSVQSEQERIREMTRKSIRVSTYLILPLVTGLAVCAEPFIRILLTEKWISCAPYLQLFCITSALHPIHTSNLNAIKALGRSDIFLKLDIVKKAVGIIILIITIPFGPLAIAVGLVFGSLISQFINSFPNKKLLNYTYLQQVYDMLPYIALSAVMGGCVYLINFLHLSDWASLAIQIPLGAIIYIGGSILFKMETYHYLLDILKASFKKMKRK